MRSPLRAVVVCLCGGVRSNENMPKNDLEKGTVSVGFGAHVHQRFRIPQRLS